MSGAVFVVGALHLDVVVRAPRLPRLDETLVGSAVDYRLGGKGGNQAAAAAAMGAGVAMAGAVGTDAFGATMLDALAAAGVATGQVRRVDGASGMSVAIIEAGGEYGAVVVTGANAMIDPDQIEIPADARVLCLQNEIPEPVNLALAQAARARGLTVILNAAPARDCASRLLDQVDILVVNRGEAEAFAPAGPDAETARALAPLGPDHVIVTLGGDGLVWFAAGQRPRNRPAFAVEQRSAHGAGDMFVGTLAAALAAETPMAGALDRAQAAAALFVSDGRGARGGVTPERVARLVAGQGAAV